MFGKTNSFFDDTKSSTLRSSMNSKDDLSPYPKQKIRSSSLTEVCNIKKPILQIKESIKNKKEGSKSLDAILKKKELLFEKKKKPRLNYILKSNLTLKRDIGDKTFYVPHRTNRLVSYFSPYNNQKMTKVKVPYSSIPEQKIKFKEKEEGEDEKETEKEEGFSPAPIQGTKHTPSVQNKDDNPLTAFFYAKSYSKGSNGNHYHQSNSHCMNMNMNMNLNVNLNMNMNMNINQMDNIYFLKNQKVTNNLSYISESKNEDIISFINTYTIDQASCRFLQSKIHNNAHFANNIFFPSIQHNIIEMILNQFGNYLIQNTIEILTIPNLIEFLNLISPNFIRIAYSPHGTRVIQKYIEHIYNYNDILMNFNLQLKNNIASFSNDENANHIIQKYVSVVKYPANSFIYDNIFFNLFNIAITKHGCCVVQKCILFGTKVQKETIVFLIIKNTYQLIMNQFGNYVYQFIIQMNNPVFNKEIIKMIIPNLFVLCKHKYASNALEKCLLLKNAEMPQIIMYELLKQEDLFIDLLLDNYGNYVIQIALNIKNQFYLKAIQVIANNYDRIIQVPFGFKLMKKLLSFYQELGIMINQIKQCNLNQQQQKAYRNIAYQNE